jgi:hypothetical protein
VAPVAPAVLPPVPYCWFAWVILPNHVHLVLRPQGTLSASLRWLKTATATRANRVLGKTGEAFWQREYFDRWIRSEKELASVVAYEYTGGKTAGATRGARPPVHDPRSSESQPDGFFLRFGF